MEHFLAFQADIETAPLWVRYWLGFMGVVLMLAFPFAFFRVEARWALLVIALTAPAMIALHSMIGYVRLLGVVHVAVIIALGLAAAVAFGRGPNRCAVRPRIRD